MNVNAIKPIIQRYFFIVSLIVLPITVFSKESQKVLVYKIAFGSCLDQNLKKDIWLPILKAKPDLWIWLGDNIYKDTVQISEKETAYREQKSDEQYALLRKNSKIMGTWDDHDFGYNDVGAEYPLKKESKELFLDFMDVPIHSPIRKHEGIYSSETIKFGKLSIKIILLDTRTFRTQLKTNSLPNLGGKEYIANDDPNASILGLEQWSWLENELRSKDDLFIIVSSIQVLNDTHRYEKWSNFSLDKKKLIDLLEKYGSGKSLILSGDRHIAEIFEERLNSGFIIADITSSSMNKPIPLRAIEVEDPRRKSKIYANENFGLLEISKVDQNISVDVSIVGLEGKTIEKRYLFNLLNKKNKSKKKDK